MYILMKELLFLFKFINWYVLIITFILGLFFNTGLAGEKSKIFIYPTKDNNHLLQVQDHSGTCFSFEPEEVECSGENIVNIPIQ